MTRRHRYACQVWAHCPYVRSPVTLRSSRAFRSLACAIVACERTADRAAASGLGYTRTRNGVPSRAVVEVRNTVTGRTEYVAPERLVQSVGERGVW